MTMIDCDSALCPGKLPYLRIGNLEDPKLDTYLDYHFFALIETLKNIRRCL